MSKLVFHGATPEVWFRPVPDGYRCETCGAWVWDIASATRHASFHQRPRDLL